MSVSRILQKLHPQLHCSSPSSSWQNLPIKYVDISYVLSICGKEANLHVGSSYHAYLIKNPKFFELKHQQLYNIRNVLIVWNSLLSMYSKCGKLSDAVKLFDKTLIIKDTVSWNSIISGFLRNEDFKTGFDYFRKMMLHSGTYRFDQATLTTILSACDGISFLVTCKMLHGLAILSGYKNEITVGNALITAYCRCESSDSGRLFFHEMVEKNVITWTAVISGLAQTQLYEESLKLFCEMYSGSVVPNKLTYLGALLACSGLQALKEGRQLHGIVCKLGFNSDVCIESALMDMYSKCGSVDDTWKIFESAEVIDDVSITIILASFAQNGYEEEAIEMFVKMFKSGLEIDSNMISAVLGVFGIDTSLSLGKQVHSLVIKKGFMSNQFINNGLINMYSKCGDLEESVKVFEKIPQRNSVSWNSIIAAFARHGNGFKAIELYEEMRFNNIEPTDITFLSLLHACSHVGLVNKGIKLLESMEKDYKLKPRMEHYACIVDMLGRAGLVKEAKRFILGLNGYSNVLLWQALLGACGIHGETEIGSYAAQQLVINSPNSPVPYVTMANIYSIKGRWKERARTIKKMKEVGVMKETGVSWIEIEKQVHSFVVADQMHPQNDALYITLSELLRHMRDEGYVPDKRFVLTYTDQDEKRSCIVPVF